MDPVDTAPPFVPPTASLDSDITDLCQLIEKNNVLSMGVRKNPWEPHTPAPLDIARDRAQKICAVLYPYFLGKIGSTWCGIPQTSAILCGVVKRVLRYRGSWVGVAAPQVEDWVSRVSHDLHMWVSTMPGWTGTVDHTKYLVDNIVSAYEGTGAQSQRAKRGREKELAELRAQVRTMVEGQATLLAALVPAPAPAVLIRAPPPPLAPVLIRAPPPPLAPVVQAPAQAPVKCIPSYPAKVINLSQKK